MLTPKPKPQGRTPRLDRRKRSGSGGGVRSLINTRFRRWLDHRIPAAREVTLDQRRIFIFPSRQGFAFLVVVAAILIAAVNYENNMVYGVAFLLLAVFVSTIMHTYGNLSGLVIRAMHTRTAFAGEDAEFNIALCRQHKRVYHGLIVGWPQGSVVVENLLRGTQRPVRLFVKTQQRGRLHPGRLHIETFYPMGFLRAWTWIDLDMHCIVYPRPLFAGALPHHSSVDNEDGAASMQRGADDFAGFRGYQAGDSLKSVHWRSLAKGQPLQTRLFSSLADRRLWLEWDQVSGDQEQRLSKLCYWVLEAAKGPDEYGLKLPGAVIAPGRGDEHRQTLLRQLALYGVADMDKERVP
jgi:uncharacterized protein (DUF58 family)